MPHARSGVFHVLSLSHSFSGIAHILPLADDNQKGPCGRGSSPSWPHPNVQKVLETRLLAVALSWSSARDSAASIDAGRPHGQRACQRCGLRDRDSLRTSDGRHCCSQSQRVQFGRPLDTKKSRIPDAKRAAIIDHKVDSSCWPITVSRVRRNDWRSSTIKRFTGHPPQP